MFDFDAFATAWATGDADRCAALMHPDGVWLYTEGDAPTGTSYRGRDAIRAAAQAMFASMPDATFFRRTDTLIDRHHALCTWTFTATTPRGRALRADGVDLLTLDDHGQILVKDSYVKHVR
jgi:uncharacterized protein (TIGR02246 family)